MKTICLTILVFICANNLLAQVQQKQLKADSALTFSGNLEMRFKYKNGTKDTFLTVQKLLRWGHYSTSPSYIKLVNKPLALVKSANKFELFTDSTSNLVSGDTIGCAFIKQNSTGTFIIDCRTTDLGSLLGNSTQPNMEIVSTAVGLVMVARQGIAPNTPLTFNQHDLKQLFPNDPTIK